PSPNRGGVGRGPDDLAASLLDRALRGEQIALTPDQLTPELAAAMRALAENETGQRAEAARQLAAALEQALSRVQAGQTGPLLHTLNAFITANTWPASQQIVEQHPELLSHEADRLMGDLIDAQDDDGARQMLQEHRTLLRRCREIGVDAAFAEKTGGGFTVPDRFRSDWDEAQAHVQHYLRTGDPTALDRAAAAWNRILDHPAFPQTEEPFRLAAMNNAGGVFLRRYWARGRPEDLNRALQLWQQAVAATPEGSPDLPSILNNLGNGLRDRFARTGRVEDLEEAIRVYQEAVAATPEGSPDLPGYLNNLGNGLRARFARTGRVEDLEEAIRVYQQAVAATPEGSPD
ncbi:MAG: hypothetical protein D6759_17425, partial [Chloroflexi bacterium]